MRGFTLIELVATLVLISILAVAVWPRAPSSDSLTLRGRAEQLASDIRYAQTLSMTRGSRFCVVITASDYELRTTDAADSCTAVREPNPAGLGATGAISVCTSCLATSFGGTLQFDGKGVPYTGPGAPLGGAGGTVTVSGDGGPKTITVSANTGRVIVQ